MTLPIRLTHFFKGNLRREESTSALLAMALEGVPSFRRYFFDKLLGDEAISLSDREWVVEVEKDWVDVRMDADRVIVLIENKMNSSANRPAQLLEYYTQVRREHVGGRIIAVYLAPGEIGAQEVERVRNSQPYREHPNDKAEHLSWEKLLEYEPNSGDIRDTLVSSGLYEVQEIIKQGLVYPPDGDRGIIRNLVTRASELLPKELVKKGISVNLRRWSGKDFEEILTVRTSVTIWIDTEFDVEDDPPFRPNLRDKDGQMMRVRIRSQFRLPANIGKISRLAQWWSQNMASNGYNVPAVGWHKQEEKQSKWFVHTREITGTAESITEAVVEVAAAVIATLSDLLSSGGFKLAEVDYN